MQTNKQIIGKSNTLLMLNMKQQIINILIFNVAVCSYRRSEWSNIGPGRSDCGSGFGEFKSKIMVMTGWEFQPVIY